MKPLDRVAFAFLVLAVVALFVLPRPWDLPPALIVFAFMLYDALLLRRRHRAALAEVAAARAELAAARVAWEVVEHPPREAQVDFRLVDSPRVEITRGPSVTRGPGGVR